MPARLSWDAVIRRASTSNFMKSELLLCAACMVQSPVESGADAAAARPRALYRLCTCTTAV